MSVLLSEQRGVCSGRFAQRVMSLSLSLSLSSPAGDDDDDDDGGVVGNDEMSIFPRAGSDERAIFSVD